MSPTEARDFVANEELAAPWPSSETTGSISGKRWAILILLSVGALIAFVDRTSISSALAVPSFKAHFHLSDTDRGWINSAFFWSYAVLQIPMGWAVDRYGVKKPYTLSFLLWCLASAMTGFVTTTAALIVMRLLVGAAEAVVVPATYRWIRNNFREEQTGTAIGLYMLGTKIGPAIGAPIAAWLIVSFNWHLMFLISGVAGIVWLLPWLLLAENDGGQRGNEFDRKASPIPASALLINPLVWGTMVVCFCYNYFTFYCMTWMPAYLVEQRHLSLEQMGLYSFFSFGGIAIVAIAAGWAADRIIMRGADPVFVRKAFTIAGFLVASTVVLGAYASTLQMALFWNVASLSGLGLATANNLALTRLTLIPPQVIGLITGFQQVATSLAGILAPILSGWLLHVSGSYDLPMQVIFLFLIIGALTTAMLKPEWAPKVPSE